MSGEREVVLLPYDPSWRDAFERVAAEVRGALGAELRAVHHIGSTSIPAVAWAKPVLDLLAEVSSVEQADRAAGALAALGFEARGEYGIPGRRYFVRPAAEGAMKVHLHAYASGDPEVARHVTFRDYLLAHPEEARAYSVLKRDLARDHGSDRPTYQAGKSDFIVRTDRAAAQWKMRGGAEHGS